MKTKKYTYKDIVTKKISKYDVLIIVMSIVVTNYFLHGAWFTLHVIPSFILGMILLIVFTYHIYNWLHKHED